MALNTANIRMSVIGWGGVPTLPIADGTLGVSDRAQLLMLPQTLSAAAVVSAVLRFVDRSGELYRVVADHSGYLYRIFTDHSG